MKLLCSCGLLLRVSGDSMEIETLLGPRSDWAQAGQKCPRCGKEMIVAEVVEGSAVLETVDVTPQEAFTAVNGMGLPSERDCGETAVRELFKLPIVDVGVYQIGGSNRSVLSHIEFEGGTTLYLAAGTSGATAFRISTPRKFVEEELCQTR